MQQRNTGGYFLIAAVIAALTMVVVVIARPDLPDGTDSHAHIQPEESLTGAATTVMVGIHTWNPADEHSPWEAMAAVSEHLTGRMAEAAASRPMPDPTPQAWDAWARSGDRVIGHAEILGDPGDPDGDTATVTVEVGQTVMHTGGETTPFRSHTAAVELEHAEGRWLVENYSYTR